MKYKPRSVLEVPEAYGMLAGEKLLVKHGEIWQPCFSADMKSLTIPQRK